MVGMTVSGRVDDSTSTAVSAARAALLSVDPLADPLFPMTLLGARRDAGLPADPWPLLHLWSTRALSQSRRLRYRWTISAWPSLDNPAHLAPRESWVPWRPRDVAKVAEDRAGFEERLITPLVIAEALEWISECGTVDGEVGELARTFLAESKATARRDAAGYAQEVHAGADTWALWCFARHPHVLRLLHPFALAIAEAYADTTIAHGGDAVRGTRFPFAGVPLVSASAMLAGGCLALGVHPKLTGSLADWIAGQQHADGGFGDGDGPSDVLTTLAAADLLCGLDPAWDVSPAVAFLTAGQDPRGWWRAYGPETVWLTVEIVRFLERARRPFAERFRWPEVATINRDRRTELPRYDYYADLARLCQEVSGLGRAPVEVAFLDLAHFGEFNNAHGMAAGDAALREFGQALNATPGILAIRDGGDEFLVLGAPGASGLVATLDGFRQDWPARLRARFGDDARVAPRILVAGTTGRNLVDTRDYLGLEIADLKMRDPVGGIPAEGVLVDRTDRANQQIVTTRVEAARPGPAWPRVYVVRHGETDWNAAGRLLSRTDEPLNAVGEAQAARVASELANIRWDRAFSSPLLRARRTAEVILAARQDSPPLVLDDRLVELDFGPYEGWSEAELEADPVAVTRRRDGATLPGAETEAAVEARARAFFAEISDLPGTTLLVGHGRMLRILIATCVLGFPAEAARRMRMRNCRPAIIEPGRSPLLLAFNVGPIGDEASAAAGATGIALAGSRPA